MLQKGLYLYEYMDDWEKFNETLSPEKENYADYAHAKRVSKDFDIKNFGEYHDLYVQSDTLLLANVFENFRSLYLEIYLLDPANLLSAPGLA